MMKRERGRRSRDSKKRRPCGAKGLASVKVDDREKVSLNTGEGRAPTSKRRLHREGKKIVHHEEGFACGAACRGSERRRLCGEDGSLPKRGRRRAAQPDSHAKKNTRLNLASTALRIRGEGEFPRYNTVRDVSSLHKRGKSFFDTTEKDLGTPVERTSVT